MRSMKKLHKVLLGVGAFGGAAYCYLHFNPSHRKRVFNSWTTDYAPSPSAKWDENWDQRSPKLMVHPRKISNECDENQVNEQLEAAKPSATKHLILIRHGQYNVDGKTDEERKLTALGRSQAEYTGRRLRELGLPYTDMVKSTMSRAQETGAIIAQSLPDIPVHNCDLIREGAPIPPEPPVGHWKPRVYQFYQDGARIEAGFRRYFHRAEPCQKGDSYTVIVCHANVIRYFVCRALQFPPEAWLRLALNHASITWVQITPGGRVTLRALGDSGHIPAEMVTSH